MGLPSLDLGTPRLHELGDSKPLLAKGSVRIRGLDLRFPYVFRLKTK